LHKIKGTFSLSDRHLLMNNYPVHSFYVSLIHSSGNTTLREIVVPLSSWLYSPER